MDQDRIDAIQRSFRAVLTIKQQAAALFYDRLFRVDPELRQLFVLRVHVGVDAPASCASFWPWRASARQLI